MAVSVAATLAKGPRSELRFDLSRKLENVAFMPGIDFSLRFLRPCPRFQCHIVLLSFHDWFLFFFFNSLFVSTRALFFIHPLRARPSSLTLC